jgi:hypothetical protein
MEEPQRTSEGGGCGSATAARAARTDGEDSISATTEHIYQNREASEHHDIKEKLEQQTARREML